jgi:hypothetical protein
MMLHSVSSMILTADRLMSCIAISRNLTLLVATTAGLGYPIPHTHSYKLKSENDIKFVFCLSANVETAGGEEPSETATELFALFPIFP